MNTPETAKAVGLNRSWPVFFRFKYSFSKKLSDCDLSTGFVGLVATSFYGFFCCTQVVLYLLIVF